MTDLTIDSSAPVVARLHRNVDAPLDVVWAVHVGVAAWPEWQPDIEELRSDAPVLHAGGWFSWSSGGLSIRSEVQRVDDVLHETFWGGPANGITGLHRWALTAAPGGGTRVLTEESWSGGPVEADVPGAQQALEASLERWLDCLAARAGAVAKA